MDKWEYKIVWKTHEGFHDQGMNTLLDWLNEWGAQGWEAVSWCSSDNSVYESFGLNVLLKRRLP